MSSTSLASLLDAVRTELCRDARGPRLARLLGDYAIQEDDWRRFALFDPETYARNLVQRSDLFEMMVVCWGQGQESPIHNHAGQNCWMAVLEGEMEEIHYDAPHPHGPLKAGRATFHPRGKVAFINDEIALHKVRPRKGGSGVSLHVYSRPIEACNVFDEVTGRVVRRELAFHSVGGVLTI